MEATQSLGTLHRLYKGLMAFLMRPVFAKPAPARRRTQRPAQRVEQVAKPAPEVIPQQSAPVVAPVIAALVAPAVTGQAPERKPMRTLAEVRADLARLREKSRERQAQQRATLRRDAGFPATDFMAYVPSVPESPAAKEDASETFAPTAYLDFTVIKAR